MNKPYEIPGQTIMASHIERDGSNQIAYPVVVIHPREAQMYDLRERLERLEMKLDALLAVICDEEQ